MALERLERIEVFNTIQVKSYDLYDMAKFLVADKMQWHEWHWEQDLQHASKAERRIVEK